MRKYRCGCGKQVSFPGAQCSLCRGEEKVDDKSISITPTAWDGPVMIPTVWIPYFKNGQNAASACAGGAQDG